MRIDRVKLISEMARQDVTVKALAEKALVSRMTVSAMRAGQVMRCGKSVNDNSARHVARALGVDVADLLESKGE